MRIIDIIEKKKRGEILSRDEIRFWIKGLTDGSIPEYQSSALLMAILLKGMTNPEIYGLTGEMRDSGERLDLSSIEGIKADKHSTGGVGDKTSLVLMPMVASLGVKVAKMSGRGLGHTGGTLDKLESIPGLSITKTLEEFINQVNDIGLAIVGQNKSLAPADKKLYALRDVTATVDSIPLIASSVMSKKLATGCNTLVLEVTVGSGAFMKTYEDAYALASLMVKIGEHHDLNTAAVITNMDEPLGNAIGNTLEVKEVIEALHGRGPKDLMELCYEAGTIILKQAGITSDKKEALRLLRESINSGKAFDKFVEMVRRQGGDVSYLYDPNKFVETKYHYTITAYIEGYISKIDALTMGIEAMKLGAGRSKMGDRIDYAAGIYLHHKVGDYIKKDEKLLTIYTNKLDFSQEIDNILRGIEISQSPVKTTKLILGTIEHE